MRSGWMVIICSFVLAAFLMNGSAAQTQTPIDSWWNIVDPTWTKGITAAPLTPTGPLDTLAQPLPVGGLTTAITFPASPIAYAMTGLRVSMTMSGTNWKMTDPSKPFQLDVTFVAPLSVPAGATATITYNATLSGLAGITAIAAVPPPPPPVTCVRIPPTSPTTGEVKDFTPRITDSTGAVWTIAPRVMSSDTLIGQVSLWRTPPAGGTAVRQFGGIFYAWMQGTNAVCVSDDPKTGPAFSCYVAPGWVPVAGPAGC